MTEKDAEKLTDPEIIHEEGQFDEFLLSFYFETDEESFKWSPKNEDMFKIFEMWFQSEDEGYPDGFGSDWQLFFIILTQMYGKEKAVTNNKLSGYGAKQHFLCLVDEHGDEVVEELEELVEEAREELDK